MTGHFRIRLALGALVWALTLIAVGRSLMTVHARTSRPVAFVILRLEDGMTLAPGDMVYLASDAGLKSVGEVSAIPHDDGRVPLAVDPLAFRQLNETACATVWRTPLSAEEALAALLPPTVQRKAAEIIIADWRRHQEPLAEAWGPLAADMALAFIQTIQPDLEAAVARREEEILRVFAAHREAFGEVWPEVEARVSPILATHLTPVLTRQLESALSEVPKMRIVWHVARGRHATAFSLLLDWVADYLTHMPTADRAALSEAVRRTMTELQDDPVLAVRFSQIGEGIVRDRELAAILNGIYREAVTENPRTAQFLHEEVMRSPRVQSHFYDLIERFGPTARSVAAACLFDEQGTTRAEIVQFVRSVALDREVSWVTIRNLEVEAAPLATDAILPAQRGGTP